MCLQNNENSVRITSFYRSQPSSAVFTCTTTTLAPELQVSMGPSPHLLFFAFTTASLWPELIVSMGPWPYLSLCACKTTRLTSELLVSMGPILRLWFLHAKLRLYDQNYKYLWVPALICCFFRIHNRVIMTRINSLYWSQASPVVVCMQNNEINIRITSLYGSQPSSVVFACKTATLWPELQVSIGPTPHLWFFAFKTESF